MNKRYNPTRNGNVLPLVMIAVILLLILGASLLSMGLTNRFFSLHETSDVISRCAADAGITQALFKMNQILDTGSISSYTLPTTKDSDLPECKATYSYIVKGTLASGYTITSLGESGKSKRAIAANIALKGLFDNAILTKEQLILKLGTIIKAYDSSDPTASDLDLIIGTQNTASGSIVLNNSVIVGGDVAVGLGGDVDNVIKDLGATIAGDKYEFTEEYPMPDITIPTLFNMGTSLSVKSSTITVTPSESGIYSSIDLSTGKDIGVLEITGGDVELHITGDIDLGNGCEIVVRDGSTLKLYVDGNINCDNGSGINAESTNKDASTLQLFGTGTGTQSFNLKAKSDWIGTVYAPNADVILFAGSDVYGSFVSNSFEYKNGGDFYYDVALQKVTQDDPGVRFVITQWKEGILNTSFTDWDSLNITEVGVLKE